MNILHFVLICQFVFVKAPKVTFVSETSSVESHSSITGADSSTHVPPSYTDSPLPDINIVLKITPDHDEHLHLKLVYRVLANEHLQIWTVEKKARTLCAENVGCGLKLEHGVMKQLGGLSFYQDLETRSAAVYYHRRREFDGMIDTRYLIHRLSIDKIHAAAKTKIQIGESGIIHRPESMDHPPLIIHEDLPPANLKYEIRKTYGNHSYSGYPEILVIVSCDLAQALLLEDKNHPDRYTSLVSYVLTLFNGADMLYSKLKETNIKLNIAGIIIESVCGSLSFLKKCYDQPYDDHKSNSNMLLDAVCVIENLQPYLYECGHAIPFDSYDVTVFLTRNALYFMKDGEKYELEGLSNSNGVYNQKQLYQLPGLVATIHDDGHLRSYGVIAHELAHMMNVPHDEQVLREDGECCRNIMKIEGTYWCKECLSWSYQSEQAFKAFFSSADCCGFTNKPRSLYTPGPREMLTADEQCRCYGYESTTVFPIIPRRFCKFPMLCLDENNGVHQTIIPLDGTPCSFDKVTGNAFAGTTSVKRSGIPEYLMAKNRGITHYTDNIGTLIIDIGELTNIND